MKTIHKSGIILPFLFLLTLLSQKAFSQANSGVNPELVFYKHYYGNGIAQPIKTLDDSLGTIRFRALEENLLARRDCLTQQDLIGTRRRIRGRRAFCSTGQAGPPNRVGGQT